MTGSKTVANLEVPPLHRFEDVAKQYGLEVRALKSQVRALGIEWVQLGIRWYFKPDQLAAYHAASTKSAKQDPAQDPLAQVRARLARHRTSGQRKGSTRSGRR